MPLILYGFERSPPCRAVLLAARALGVPLQLKITSTFENQHKTEQYLKINPLHTVPALDDDGFYLPESRAIMTYLADKYGKDDKLYPKDVKKRALVNSMLHHDGGTTWPTLNVRSIVRLNKFDSSVEENFKIRMSAVETLLGMREYLAGDELSLADISAVVTLSVVDAMNLSLAPYPNLAKWVSRVKTELPFYDEVCKTGETELNEMIREKIKTAQK